MTVIEVPFFAVQCGNCFGHSNVCVIAGLRKVSTGSVWR
jgi:hypothetical protein